MGWTKEQEKAITTEGNIIVSAAAGSGKTAVLAERVAEKVAKGTDINEILVVTFTNLAAEEMKKRIEMKLYERADAERNMAKRARLHDQAQGVAKANISTLHSFCLHLIRRYFFKTDLPPLFRTVDDAEQVSLRAATMDETLDKLFETDSNAATALISVLGGEDKLIGFITGVYKYINDRPDGEEWLEKSVEAYNVTEDELAKSDLVNEFLWRAKEEINNVVRLYDSILLLVKEYPRATAFFGNTRQMYADLLHCEGYDNLFHRLQKPPNVNKCDIDDADLYHNSVKPLNDKAKECIKSLTDNKFSIAEQAKEMNFLYPYMKQLAAIVLDFRDNYSKCKMQAGVIDFSDMEILALKLLQDPTISESCQECFKYIFVDEYQDINLLQDRIIDSMKREDNLFFVGDVKQSIYRFRNAEPKLFINKVACYSDGKDGCTINLSSNFRSSNSVINFSNEIFTCIMKKRTGEIDYDESCALVKEGESKEGSIDINIILKLDNPDIVAESDGENSIEDEEKVDVLVAEAKLAAQHIHELMNSDGFYDSKEKEFRKYKYSDFAVLMRSTANKSDIFANVFAMEGIPCFTDLKGGFFNTLEVKIFKNLLVALNNRQLDIPLMSVMRSPIGNFEIEEIAELRVNTENSKHQSKKSVFECLGEVSNSDSSLGRKAKRLIENLDEWYGYSQLLSMEELVSKLFHKSGLYAYVSALPNGYVRSLNLDMLINIASDFDSNVGGGLHSFLRYLSSAESSSQQGEAQDKSANVVQILTIHKSKGLEFNVVILPNLNAQLIPKAPSREGVLLSSDYGIGVRYRNNSVVQKSLIFEANVLLKVEEEKSDSMRLLYVALTRARERLILIATDTNLEKSVRNFSKMGDNTIAQTLSAGSFYHWLLIGMLNSRYCNAIKAIVSDNQANAETLNIHKHYISDFSLRDNSDKQTAFFGALNDFRKIELCDEDYYLGWEYPFIASTIAPSKRTVTGLVSRVVPPKLPSFMENTDTPLNALDLGSATHVVFERISIKAHDEASVKEEIQRIVSDGHLTQQEADSINIRGIVNFFSSDLGKRLIASPLYEREQEFTCRFPANELLSNSESSEYMLLQGVVDCCFLENGKWILVDYKTDSVSGFSEERLQKHALQHLTQLQLYARALEIMTKKEVMQGYIHFVQGGCVKLIDKLA
ncbi:MAG: helicase-exonuclease AddAB subunit AddA [Clostridiales bacterium]|nr:helicase-exonuclease AddAB subunit AddA [Clostridiales bacterium]